MLCTFPALWVHLKSCTIALLWPSSIYAYIVRAPCCRGRGWLADGLSLGKEQQSFQRCELEPKTEPEAQVRQKALRELLAICSYLPPSRPTGPSSMAVPRQGWLATTSSPSQEFVAGCRGLGAPGPPSHATAWKNLFLKALLLLNNNPWHFCDTLIIVGYLLVRVEGLWHLEQECAGPVLPIKEQ